MSVEKKIPLRKCVGCGEMKPKKELIRILKTDDGRIAIDTTGRANGRGAYICPDTACLETAVRRKALERSLKAPVSAELWESLKEEMQRIDQS